MSLSDKNVVSTHVDTVESDATQLPNKAYPYSHLLYSEVKRTHVLAQHLFQVHHGLQLLATLPQGCLDQLRKRASNLQIRLPGTTRRKPTLFIDLDETLLHSSPVNDGRYLQQMQVNGSTIFFNVRPHALAFLQNLKQHYELVMFTAAVQQYASIFYKWLNSKTNNAFIAFLSREHCIELYPGIYVKDLSCISNRKANNMLLIDNWSYSFGSMLSNGIPICNFTHDHEDQQLLYLEKYLIQLAKEKNPVEVNQQKMRLHEIIQQIVAKTAQTQQK